MAVPSFITAIRTVADGGTADYSDLTEEDTILETAAELLDVALTGMLQTGFLTTDEELDDFLADDSFFDVFDAYDGNADVVEYAQQAACHTAEFLIRAVALNQAIRFAALADDDDEWGFDYPDGHPFAAFQVAFVVHDHDDHFFGHFAPIPLHLHESTGIIWTGPFIHEVAHQVLHGLTVFIAHMMADDIDEFLTDVESWFDTTDTE